MRAADLAKGKNPSQKVTKDDSLAPNILNERLEQKREALRLRDLEGIGYPEIDRQSGLQKEQTEPKGAEETLEVTEKGWFSQQEEGVTLPEAHQEDDTPRSTDRNRDSVSATWSRTLPIC